MEWYHRDREEESNIFTSEEKEYISGLRIAAINNPQDRKLHVQLHIVDSIVKSGYISYTDALAVVEA